MEMPQNINFKETIKDAIKEALEEVSKEKETDEKATLTIDSCVKYSGIGRDKILELAHNPNSDFPRFKVGSKFLINRTMFDKWLDKISKEKRVL
ncbi:excisionase [Clostridium coskatii]|uniref:Excisionase from transposon Tn916 n=1 Tax=Clostridium coskatii TaxID=1705578 RepID=A0A168MAQ8_9CLOT|nr:excisionase [Clostridium coskatii]OAA84451.1 Excisionase from transposon Tn916 [Clostridium coskatii]OBR94081.1 excisionase from transposon Tn916 [Clostridium coskatii]